MPKLKIPADDHSQSLSHREIFIRRQLAEYTVSAAGIRGQQGGWHDPRMGRRASVGRNEPVGQANGSNPFSAPPTEGISVWRVTVARSWNQMRPAPNALEFGWFENGHCPKRARPRSSISSKPSPEKPGSNRGRVHARFAVQLRNPDLITARSEIASFLA
jgi:hypothetical protein